jgi:hypothetical protein
VVQRHSHAVRKRTGRGAELCHVTQVSATRGSFLTERLPAAEAQPSENSGGALLAPPPRAPPPSFSSEPQAASRALSGPLDANVNSVEKSLEIASTGNTAERGARADPDGHEERTHAEESSLDEEFGSFVG